MFHPFLQVSIQELFTELPVSLTVLPPGRNSEQDGGVHVKTDVQVTIRFQTEADISGCNDPHLWVIVMYSL